MAQELNGLANIVMHIRHCRHKGIPVDLDYLEKQALMQLEYLRLYDDGKRVWWYEIREPKIEPTA